MAEKVINSKCACGSVLIYTRSNLIMVDPCEHILHTKCLSSHTECPLCGVAITGTYTSAQLRGADAPNLYQKYVDMTAMTNFDTIYRPRRKFFNMIDIMGIVSKIPFISGFSAGQKVCRDLFCLMDSKIVAHGLHHIRPGPKVFVANHTSYLDFAVIFYLLKCGFLASSVIRDIWLGKQIMNIVPLLITDRGKSENTVEKMREYVEQNGSICLFPEGMITHPDTIIRFRTGAFHVGYPILPVVIRYEPVIYDTNIKRFIEKLISEPKITIHVDVLPQELPPFSESRIEEIRTKMAHAGNMALSRVSNKDINDDEVRRKERERRARRAKGKNN